MTQTATQRVTFNSGDLKLEGVLAMPGSGAKAGVVVCHPHPQMGGDMDNNVVVALCDALVGRGIAALRFNFRGAGDSDGAFDQGAGERDDVQAALAFLPAAAAVERIGLAGYSFGAMVASEAAPDGLAGLALVSPPLKFGDLRVQWGCPALLAGGDEDAYVPEDRLRLAAGSSEVELHVFEGVDHFWLGSEDELGEKVAAFFERLFA